MFCFFVAEVLAINMNRSERFVAAIIPFACVIFFLLYFYKTQNYHEFISVQFPYTISVIGLCLFIIITVLECKKLFSVLNKNPENLAREHLTINLSHVKEKKRNPFYVVILTLIFAILLLP